MCSWAISPAFRDSRLRGTRRRPHVPEDHADLLRRKGEEHETAYLAELRKQGRQVVNVITADRWDFATSARATEEAMRAGAEIIYQATFVRGDWRGRADFLERVAQPTALGAWGYEALDAVDGRQPYGTRRLLGQKEGRWDFLSLEPRGQALHGGPGEPSTVGSGAVVYPNSFVSACAFSSQNRMSISWYIVVAVVRCSWASSRLSVRR